jgi:heptosyltransferase-2
VLLSAVVESSIKTLVIRFSSIGDIVLTTPLLRVLRARFPDGQIDFVTKTEFSELVRSNHNLNLTYEYDASTGVQGLVALGRRLRKERYTLVVDAHNSLRSRLLRMMLQPATVVTPDKRLFARFMLVHVKKNLYGTPVSVADRYIEPLRNFGIQPDGKGPELHIPDEILFGVSGKIAKLRLHRFERVIGLCPSAKHETKRWPAERFAALGVRLTESQSAKILLFGGSEDAALTSSIAARIAAEHGEESVTDFSGTFSLLETAAAMEFCDVVVTNDTGLMHLASAMGRSLVAIFGSTVREFGFFPFGERSIVEEVDGLPCRPCSHIGRRKCPERHFRCMLDIEVERVKMRVDELLAVVSKH